MLNTAPVLLPISVKMRFDRAQHPGLLSVGKKSGHNWITKLNVTIFDDFRLLTARIGAKSNGFQLVLL